MHEPQSLIPKYRIALFVNMYKDLSSRQKIEDWYSALNKARLLRLLIADDYSNQEGFNALAQDISEILDIEIEFGLQDQVFGQIEKFSRIEFLNHSWGIFHGSDYTTIKIIQLMTNKLGGVHIEPVFERTDGSLKKIQEHSEKFLDIEKAFHLKIYGKPALRYWIGVITEVTLIALELLYQKALDFDTVSGRA